MSATTQLPRLAFRTRATWRRWLQSNHSQSSGVWLIYYRKGTAIPSVSYDEAVEEALCFGWIDSIVKSVDSESYVQLFTPRKPKSGWSRTNKIRVGKLIAANLMAPAGMARIELAKENGSWESLDSVEALEVPDDFRRALNRNRKALANFERFSPSRKKALLYRINSAKRAETRAKRIRLAVRMAAENRIE